MSAGRRARAAVVGAGLMGQWHANAIRSVGSTVAVIVDPDPRRGHQVAARHLGSRVATDFEAVLFDDAIDVVHICTPLETHQALAAQALQAGKHVLAEKPLTQTASACRELVDLAEARGRLLCPVHQFLFQLGMLRAQQACATIGPLLHVDAIICSAGAAGRSRAEQDRMASDILPHPLSLLARMLPERLVFVDWKVQHPLAGELRATGVVGGVSVSVLISLRGRPTTNVLRLTGEHGTIHVDLFHGFHVVERGAVSRMHKIARPFMLSTATLQAATANLVARAIRREVAYPGLRRLVGRFYAAALGQGQTPISSREILDVAMARDTLIGLL
jgi:predicted dehydrogenase